MKLNAKLEIDLSNENNDETKAHLREAILAWSNLVAELKEKGLNISTEAIGIDKDEVTI